MDNKGLTLIELLCLITMIIMCVIFVSVIIKYGNTPVSEMPVWVYWLIGRG